MTSRSPSRTTVLAIGAVCALAMMAVPQAQSAGLVGQLGILDTSGTNPATGQPWQVGDQYRLVFISSTFVDPNNPAANDIAYWNTGVQNIANNAGLGVDVSGNAVTWNIIGSTSAVDARDNTSTNPSIFGTGHAIIAMDGSTVIENNFNDLWNGAAPQNIAFFDEHGVHKDDSTAVNWPLTGTNWNGTAHGSLFLKDTSAGGAIRQGWAFTTSPGWIDAQNTGASWSSSSAWSVYGMSEPLTVLPEPSTGLLIGLGGLLALLRRRR